MRTGMAERPVVLITGCSSGLGEALALTLHTSNFQVVATARRLATVDRLAALGIQCLSLDVTDDESVKNAVSEIVKTQGRLDILINNAGLSAIGPIAEQPLSEVSKVIEANLFGVIRVTQAAVPIMAKQGYGLILNIGSVVSQLSTPWSAAYSASKAGLLAVTDALRLEVKPFGIGVSYVIAGAIESALANNTTAGAEFERYETDSSLYSHWSTSIRMRAHMSQGDSAVPATKAAGQILAVINKAMKSNPPKPPTYFFCGGKAKLFWSIGVVQKIFGWPSNAILSRKFGLTGPRKGPPIVPLAPATS
ncbi:hypothetical protein Ndes2526B_g04081 [Nannochloris sp. 'desiccata']